MSMFSSRRLDNRLVLGHVLGVREDVLLIFLTDSKHGVEGKILLVAHLRLQVFLCVRHLAFDVCHAGLTLHQHHLGKDSYDSQQEQNSEEASDESGAVVVEEVVVCLSVNHRWLHGCEVVVDV